MFVSCIMPTRGRRNLALMAVECFECQTYPYRELVIIDDRDDPSFPEGLHVDGIRYFVAERRLTVGAKRNVACSRASGDLIAHLDSDDWSAPERLEDQVSRLVAAGKAVTGYQSMRFTDGERWWLYRGADGYAVGTSLVYRRDWWMEHPYRDVQKSEDNEFVLVARAAGQLTVADSGALMWATIHSDNTCPREIKGPYWSEIAAPEEVCV